MIRYRRAAGVPALIVCLAGFAPFLSGGEYDGRLPIWPSVQVDLDRRLPEPVAFFVEENGRDFSIYWDANLGSARLVAPTTDFPFLSASGAGLGEPITSDLETELRRAANDFIDRNEPFFGIASSDLGDGVARRLDGRWVLVLRQKTGDDVFIRGACVRFVIGKEGNLLWVESFLLPGAPAPGPFASAEPAKAFISGEKGYRLIGEEKQLFFPDRDPASPYPIWRVLAETPSRVLAEFFVDADTGELIEERHVMFSLDGGVEKGAAVMPANGRLLSRQPTTDPGSPEYFFTTPEEAEADQLVEGPQIVSGDMFSTAGSEGTFSLPVGDDVTVRLDTFLCGDEDRIDGSPFCPSELLGDDSRGPVRVLRIPEIFSEERTLASFVPLIERNGDETILKINPQPQPVPPDEQEEQSAQENLRSAELMAFHHVNQFLELHRKVLNVMSEGGRARPDIAVPLDIEVSTAPAPDFLYTPTDSSATMRLSSQAIYAGLFHQWLTPTNINHEYAHHIIFELSGIYASRTFHCYRAGKFPEGIHCVGPLTGDIPEVLNVALIESLADALAAYRASNPRFGFYSPTGDEDADHGFMSYDISNPELKPSQRTRGVMGKLFWKLRDEIDKSVSRLEDIPEARRELAPELYLYSWISWHVTSDGVDQAGIPSPELVEELYITGKELFDWDLDRGIIRDLLKELTDSASVPFRRGDANGSWLVDISDAIALLQFLFIGDRPFFTCDDAYDVDDSGVRDITDPIYLLARLFLGGQPIPPPRDCGSDPTPDDDLGCIAFPPCLAGF